MAQEALEEPPGAHRISMTASTGLSAKVRMRDDPPSTSAVSSSIDAVRGIDRLGVVTGHLGPLAGAGRGFKGGRGHGEESLPPAAWKRAQSSCRYQTKPKMPGRTK